jgi:hypothetical protein
VGIEGNWIFYNDKGGIKLKMQYRNGVLLNQGMYDSLQLQEFKTLEQMRGKIKDPAQYRDNPGELFGKSN